MISLESINGLRRLVEYRNLTWLPSLAEATYVVVLKNEAFKTYGEIARELGYYGADHKEHHNSRQEEGQRIHRR